MRLCSLLVSNFIDAVADVGSGTRRHLRGGCYLHFRFCSTSFYAGREGPGCRLGSLWQCRDNCTSRDMRRRTRRERSTGRNGKKPVILTFSSTTPEVGRHILHTTQYASRINSHIELELVERGARVWRRGSNHSGTRPFWLFGKYWGDARIRNAACQACSTAVS